MADMAPWSRRRYACVEAPVIVGEGRDSAALRMFGGATALSRVLRADGSSASVSSSAASGDAASTGSNELLCFLRPDDEFCHPLRSESSAAPPYVCADTFRAGSSGANPAPSSAPRTLSLLLRVRRMGPGAAAAAAATAASDAGSAPSRTTGEVLGCISRDFVFRELADMQFVAPMRPADAPGAAPMHMTYASPHGAGGIAMMPPRFITLRDTQQNYGFVPENAAFKREVKRARGAAKAAGDVSEESSTKRARRAAAPEPMAVPAYVNTSVGALALRKRLKELFSTRPIWVRTRLIPLLPLTGGRRDDVVSNDLLKFALRDVATYCRSGPFAHAWIRKSFDPTADAATQIFQTLDFRVPAYATGALPTVYKSAKSGKRSIAAASSSRSSSSSSSSAAAASSPAGDERALTVLGIQLQRQNYYQFVDAQARWGGGGDAAAAAPAAATGAGATLCATTMGGLLIRTDGQAASVEEERRLHTKLKALYEGATVRTQFDEKSGWFDAKFLPAARAIVKEYVLGMLGVEAPRDKTRREVKAAKAERAAQAMRRKKEAVVARAAAKAALAAKAAVTATAQTAAAAAGPRSAPHVVQMEPKSNASAGKAPKPDVDVPHTKAPRVPKEARALRATQAAQGRRREGRTLETATTSKRKSLVGIVDLGAVPSEPAAPSTALRAMLRLLPEPRGARSASPLLVAVAPAAPAAPAVAPAAPAAAPPASAPRAAAPTSAAPAASAAAAAPELQGFDILGESDEDY